MDKTRKQKAMEYILFYCLYEEPLHMALKAAVEHGVSENPREFFETLLLLHREGHVKIEDAKDSFRYVEVPILSKNEVDEYLRENEKEQFKEFPEREYYVTTTVKGQAYLEELEKKSKGKRQRD